MSEFSLNYGVEIDVDENTEDPHVEVQSLPDVEMIPEVTAHDLFREVIPGEVPELKDNLKIIGDDVAALEDLDYLIADLRRAGGMNQTFALEAQRLYPEFDGQRPVGFYSKHTSATRYKVALESLLDRVWTAIKLMIAKLRELIRKFALWLVGARDVGEALLKKSTEQMKQDVDKVSDRAVARNDQMGEDMGELQTLAKSVTREIQHGVEIKDQHGETVEVSDIDKLVAHYLYDTEAADEVRQFMEGRNPFFHDIINQGPWTQSAEALVDTLQQALSVMKQKTDLLRDTMLDDIKSSRMSDEMVNAVTLKTLNKRLDVTFQGRKMSLQDVASQLNHIYQEVEASEPHKALSFEQVFERMEAVYRTGPTQRLIQIGREVSTKLIELDDYLDKLEDYIGTIATDDAFGAPHHATAQPIREALDSIRQDVRDLSLVSHRMNAYRSVVETIGRRVVGFAYRLSVAIYRDMQVSSEESKAPQVIQELAKQARRMREKHYLGVNNII